MPKLQNALMLTDKGYKDLKKAIAACTLSNFSLMLPFGVMLQVIMELIKPLTGGELSWNRLWLLFGLGLVAAVIVFLCHKNDYKKTYVVSYMESENARTSLAEHMMINQTQAAVSGVRKMQTKDPINVGIFTAIYFVFLFLCGMLG